MRGKKCESLSLIGSGTLAACSGGHRRVFRDEVLRGARAQVNRHALSGVRALRVARCSRIQMARRGIRRSSRPPDKRARV